MTRDLLSILVGVFGTLALTGGMIQFAACGLAALAIYAVNNA